jgi:AraC-like DNA-binding protein
MNNYIPQLEIKDLSSAIGIDHWTSNEFMIFEGPIPPPKWYTPVRQDFYPFLCLESGLIRNIVDLQRYELRKNDLLFLTPAQIIQVESISPDTTGRLIAFEKTFLVGEQGHLLKKLGFLSPMTTPVLSLSDKEAENILESISEIRRKVEDINRPHRRQIVINLISSLLLEIDAIHGLRHLREGKPVSRKEAVNNQFHNLLSTHFLRERTVMFYADLLNITPKYLSELTKELTGKTAGELIDDRVILEAKVLLKNADLSIKQIAEILHFSDQFFFSKYFKNFTGISPSQYRSQN